MVFVVVVVWYVNIIAIDDMGCLKIMIVIIKLRSLHCIVFLLDPLTFLPHPGHDVNNLYNKNGQDKKKSLLNAD